MSVVPHVPPLWRESRVALEAARLFRSPVWRGDGVPAGNGRPVLLVPGFMAGDGSLGTMTRWLRANGYWTSRSTGPILPPSLTWKRAWRNGTGAQALCPSFQGGLPCPPLSTRCSCGPAMR